MTTRVFRAPQASLPLTRHSNLEDVLVAIDLSRATFRRIRWNFVWAMGYNCCMVPLAAGVLYPHFRQGVSGGPGDATARTHLLASCDVRRIRLPPWMAGAAMMVSSISVVVSSLQLRKYRRPPSVFQEAKVHRL